MLKKIIFILISSLLSVSMFSQDYNISFDSKLYDGSWGRYIGVSNQGPFFLDDNSIVFIDEEKTLILINLYDNMVKKIILDSKNANLYKYQNRIIVLDNNKYYTFDDYELTPYENDLPLVNNIFYSLNSGLYLLESGKKTQISFPGIRMNSSSLSDLPVISNDMKNIYFTVKEDRFDGSLYRYSIECKKLELIKERTTHFTLLDEDKLLVYTINSDYSHLIMSEYPGDFVILDGLTGDEIYNSDLPLFKKKCEYSINDFDTNNNGQIIAFGGFSTFSDGVLTDSYKPIILSKIELLEK